MELTDKRREIMLLLADGVTTEAIGQKMGISKRTVEKHLELMRAKMGVKNTIQLIAKSLREKLIT